MGRTQGWLRKLWPWGTATRDLGDVTRVLHHVGRLQRLARRTGRLLAKLPRVLFYLLVIGGCVAAFYQTVHLRHMERRLRSLEKHALAVGVICAQAAGAAEDARNTAWDASSSASEAADAAQAAESAVWATR